MNKWFFRRRLHSSWQVATACGGVFLGVFVAQYAMIPNYFLLICWIASCVLVIFCFWKRFYYLVPLLILGGFIFGMCRGSMIQSDLGAFRPLYGKIAVIKGSVKDDVDINTSGQLTVRLNALSFGEKALPGTLWLTASGGDIKRGDILTVKGQLREGFGNYAGVMYRANIEGVIHPEPGDIARQVRDWFADGVRRAIPDSEASLGIGYLVGQRRALPVDLVAALQIVGLTHIVVASGYNLTILVRLSRRMFVKVSKYLSVLSSGAMIVAFVAITGMSPSMTQAGLVSGLSLLAWYYGRKFHPIVLLLLAIAITVIVDPSYAWGDLGWQLSFAAFTGVMIVAPLAQRYLFGDKKPGAIGQILGETVSAQLVTAPIIIMSFGQLSNVAIISNLLVLPFVPLAMLLTFIAGLGGLIIPMWAPIIGLPAKWLLAYMIGVIDNLATLPWAVSVVNISWLVFAGCYLVIIAACVYMWRVTGYNLRDTNLVE